MIEETELIEDVALMENFASIEDVALIKGDGLNEDIALIEDVALIVKVGLDECCRSSNRPRVVSRRIVEFSIRLYCVSVVWVSAVVV